MAWICWTTLWIYYDSTWKTADRRWTTLLHSRYVIALPHLEYNPISQVLDKVDPSCMNTYLKQIFIRLIEGKHCCVQIRKWMSFRVKKGDPDQTGNSSNIPKSVIFRTLLAGSTHTPSLWSCEKFNHHPRFNHHPQPKTTRRVQGIND